VGKAPAAPLLKSHLQPSSNTGAAVAAWGPADVLGKEQEALAAGGISSTEHQMPIEVPAENAVALLVRNCLNPGATSTEQSSC